MVAILNVTKGKNKVIVSGLAGALSALIFLTAIHIAAKIAIIVSAAAVTYLLLSLIHKIRTKAEITGVSGDKVSEDEGYSSVGEGEEKDTVEEPEKTEAELEEEIIRKRAEEKMKNGLPEHMDLDGNSLAGADDTSQTRYATNYMDLMRSPPMHTNGYYQEITKVASAPKTFVTSDSMRMAERLTMEDIVNQRG
ncbi:hypothetical protein [Wolbachia endosymbiont (group A) of Scambus nigricans]|uniref:hypothetical protein n=1 Tax=Wolbachia endosymbiont (group A) of Scambus nigricans TaxID=2954055 RepID=UPI002231E2B7|nr:hypothetical protein [Wolbachia endosymbiont (group A) of Scambus nigricans]